MINPERECARETLELLRSEVATDVASFADGRVRMIGLKVREGARIAGKSLRQLAADKAALGPEVIKAARRGETLS